MGVAVREIIERHRRAILATMPAVMLLADRWRREITLQTYSQLEQHPQPFLKIVKTLVKCAPTEAFLKASLDTLAAQILLSAILKARIDAEGVRRVRDEGQEIERTGRHLWNISEEVDDKLRLTRSLLGDFRQQKRAVLGRETRNAPQNYFMAAMQDWLRPRTHNGRPCTVHVAALADILFRLKALPGARPRKSPNGFEATFDQARAAARRRKIPLE
jgi:hypothetical protein